MYSIIQLGISQSELTHFINKINVFIYNNSFLKLDAYSRKNA